MITGDYHHTAIAVARDVGMVRPEGQVVVIDSPHEAHSEHQNETSHSDKGLTVSHSDQEALLVDGRVSSADLNALVPVLRASAPDPRAVPRDPAALVPKSSLSHDASQGPHPGLIQGLSQGSSQGLDQGPSRIAMRPTAAPIRVKSVTWGDLPEAEEEQPAHQGATQQTGEVAATPTIHIDCCTKAKSCVNLGVSFRCLQSPRAICS